MFDGVWDKRVDWRGVNAELLSALERLRWAAAAAEEEEVVVEGKEEEEEEEWRAGAETLGIICCADAAADDDVLCDGVVNGSRARVAAALRAALSLVRLTISRTILPVMSLPSNWHSLSCLLACEV